MWHLKMPAMHPSTSYCNPWQRLCLGFICLTSLSWIPYASADRTAGEYFVSSLPGAPKGPLLKMHAGHIEVDEASNGHLFFWHFQNRHLADRHRTVIWINGGPGCSSEDGALMEVGPYRVREGGQLEYNNGSWDEFANLLFVDNPVGTGFSYVDTDSYIHELDTMANHFVRFLESFFDIFPEYSNDDLYIAGESYAGMHIPYIAQHILDRNRNSPPSQWNLKGLLIGNGWTSPIDQYPAYLQMAYKSGIIQRGSASAKKVESQQAVCEKILSEEGGDERVDISACEAILQEILSVTRDKSAPDDQQCINMYDIRLRDSYPSCGMSWPPDLKDVTPYLRQKDVVQALHIDSAKQSGWSECSGAVGGAFTARNSTPAVHLLPNLLAEMPIVLFSGDKDMICNHLGTETLIHNMEWNGGKGFETAPGTIAARRDWTFEGEPAGIYQYARNLTYVLFYNSSHMVPFDYPRRTRDMLDRFMNVDIATIGGDPYDSRIDGEKGQTTSVGAHPNSTQAEIESEEALNQAAWDAYYRSGEAVLVIVAIAAACWGWFVYRDRRRRADYKGLSGAPAGMLEGLSPGGYRSNPSLNGNPSGGRRDLEAADFDEAELDDLVPTVKKGYDGRGGGTYTLGSDSEDDDDVQHGKQANGTKKEG